MKRSMKIIFLSLFAAFTVMSGAVTANAYLQTDWEGPFYPDVIGTDAELDYTYYGLLGGRLAITGTDLRLRVSDAEQYPLLAGDFTLLADFDREGNFESGGISVSGWNWRMDDPYFSTISLGLKEVWFDGSGSAGTLQFKFYNVWPVHNDFYGLDPYIYLEATVDNLTGWQGAWDPLQNNNPAFWTSPSLYASNVTTRTWAPVPSAVWMLGSGLLALAAGRRFFGGRFAI